MITKGSESIQGTNNIKISTRPSYPGDKNKKNALQVSKFPLVLLEKTLTMATGQVVFSRPAMFRKFQDTETYGA
mgnify:FL=1